MMPKPQEKDGEAKDDKPDKQKNLSTNTTKKANTEADPKSEGREFMAELAEAAGLQTKPSPPETLPASASKATSPPLSVKISKSKQKALELAELVNSGKQAPKPRRGIVTPVPTDPGDPPAGATEKQIRRSRQVREDIRTLTRENETAELLAKNGFDVEQNPESETTKNPDFLVNGCICDCYSPFKPDVAKIADRIVHKAAVGQAPNVIVNLSDVDVAPAELSKAIQDELAARELNGEPSIELHCVFAVTKSNDLMILKAP